ncbi:MAG: hypothetical protein AB7F74_18395, partial [Parvibaculaceae bacterium]
MRWINDARTESIDICARKPSFGGAAEKARNLVFILSHMSGRRPDAGHPALIAAGVLRAFLCAIAMLACAVCF